MQREQDMPALWSSYSQEEQRDKAAERDKQRGMARYHLHHASLQAELLALLSGRTTHALLSRHLRGRVAANLGFLLDALVGASAWCPVQAPSRVARHAATLRPRHLPLDSAHRLQGPSATSCA